MKRAIAQGMIEGEDFYLDRGRMVFTEKYLLKKGKCCHHGCRHCPWKKKVIDRELSEGVK
jgi:hypothetical protein